MAQLRVLVLVLCTVLVLAHSAEGATRRRHAREAPPPEPDMPQRAAPATASTGRPLTPEQRRAHEEDLSSTEESDQRMAEAMERARPPRRAVITHEELARRLARAQAKGDEEEGASRAALQRHDTRTGVETLVATGEVINREPHAPAAGDASTRETTRGTAARDAMRALRANGLTEVLDTRTAPFRSIGRMYYQFGEFTYICSGAFVKPRLFLTAAHCVFDHETNSYATEIVIVPGQTDRFFPFAESAGFGAAMERPRGHVKAAQVLTYSPYTDHEDYDWDMAMIITDRNPRVSFVPADAGNLPTQLWQVSYPGSTYTDTDTPEMFQQSRRGGWTSSGTSDELIEHDVASFQGDSGGPVFEEDTATDYVRGVVSHGLVGQLVPTFQCRVSDTKFDDIQDTWSDASSVPNHSYLIPYVLGDTSSMSVVVSGTGSSLTVNFGLLNNGWAETGTITYSIRASLDPFVTSSDTLLTDGTLNTLDANTYLTYSITVADVPSHVSSGEYYIGVLWSTANTQYDNDNRRLIAGQLNVTNSGKRRHMRWFAYYATRIAPLLVCALLWL